MKLAGAMVPIMQALLEICQHPRKVLVAEMLNLMKEGCEFHLNLGEYLGAGSDTAERLAKDPANQQLYKVAAHMEKTMKLQKAVAEAVQEAGKDGLADRAVDEVNPADLPVVLQFMTSWSEDTTWLKDSMNLKSTNFKETLTTHTLKLKEFTNPYFDPASSWHESVPNDATFEAVLEQGQ